MPDDDGVTKRDHLLNVLEQAPEDSDMYNSALIELDEGPEIPYCIEHVWEWFWQIHKGRTNNMSGPNPLTWTDLLAWTVVTGIQVRPIEFEIIKEMDSAYLKYVSERQDKKRKLQDKKPKQKGTKNG
jgi:hypothetical protein